MGRVVTLLFFLRKKNILEKKPRHFFPDLNKYKICCSLTGFLNFTILGRTKQQQVIQKFSTNLKKLRFLMLIFVFRAIGQYAFSIVHKR